MKNETQKLIPRQTVRYQQDSKALKLKLDLIKKPGTLSSQWVYLLLPIVCDIVVDYRIWAIYEHKPKPSMLLS